MVCDTKDIFNYGLILCANTRHEITDFDVDGMVRNIVDRISQEWNMALP